MSVIEKIQGYSDESIKNILISLWASYRRGSLTPDDPYAIKENITMGDWESLLVSEWEHRGHKLSSIEEK